MELQGLFSSAPNTLRMLCVAAALVGFSLLWRAAKTLLWEPWAIKRAFEKQGVKCLPYYVLLGNMREVARMTAAARASPLPLLSNEVGSRIAPHYYHWKKAYGDLFVFWLGYRATFPITNPEHAKEILSNKFGHFRKLISRPDATDLSGESVASLEGERWAQHRRIVSPAFFVEKLKVMTPTMLACVDAILDKWESQLEGHDSREIDVHEQFKVLTADIIAHTAFGSSYEEGKQVFKLQQEQQVLLVKLFQSVYIPGSRYLPTSQNRYAWRLKNEIHATMQKVIDSRGENYNGNDLLGILMSANRQELLGSQRSLSLNMQEIVDECKTFFFAGHETTASLMTWTVMLLAFYTDWQEKAREEVLRVCGKESPTYEILQSLKVVGMVLNEALRLYPPGTFIVRETMKRMTLGSISVPANTVLFIPVIDFHTDPTWWGEDALDFNPQRFVDGISGACKTPLAFCPFSMGPRNCVGQNFAILLEARAILALMLRRFEFSLSPGYIHGPTTILTLQPQHGMPIIFKKLE